MGDAGPSRCVTQKPQDMRELRWGDDFLRGWTRVLPRLKNPLSSLLSFQTWKLSPGALALAVRAEMRLCFAHGSRRGGRGSAGQAEGLRLEPQGTRGHRRVLSQDVTLSPSYIWNRGSSSSRDLLGSFCTALRYRNYDSISKKLGVCGAKWPEWGPDPCLRVLSLSLGLATGLCLPFSSRRGLGLSGPGALWAQPVGQAQGTLLPQGGLAPVLAFWTDRPSLWAGRRGDTEIWTPECAGSAGLRFPSGEEGAFMQMAEDRGEALGL